jgi:hypothetical protein
MRSGMARLMLFPAKANITRIVTWPEYGLSNPKIEDPVDLLLILFWFLLILM